MRENPTVTYLLGDVIRKKPNLRNITTLMRENPAVIDILSYSIKEKQNLINIIRMEDLVYVLSPTWTKWRWKYHKILVYSMRANPNVRDLINFTRKNPKLTCLIIFMCKFMWDQDGIDSMKEIIWMIVVLGGIIIYLNT